MLVKMHRMKLGIPHIIYMMVTMSTVPTLLRYGYDNMVLVLIIPMSNKKGLNDLVSEFLFHNEVTETLKIVKGPEA